MGISAGLGRDALLPGLVLVASKTFTTTSSAQQIDNCFTSQYDNYRVIYSGTGSTTGNDFVYCRMVDGTTADTVANYYVCGYNTSTGAAVTTTWLAAQTQMRVGWIGNNYSEFVIGSTIFRRSADSSVSEDSVTLASVNNKLSHDLYETSGDLQAWTEFSKLTEKAGLDTHMFALCVSLSSPLYAFTGLKGLTISLYGPTGGGKTLAQLWMQSVWGNPDKLHFAAKFTQNTLFSRMGLYSNMPMTIDEATMMQDKDVGDFLYWVSQGRDKARLNRNAEEKDAKTFAIPVTVSTNKSMASKLISSGMDTDAQMARLLEVSVRPSLLFTKDSEAGRKINDFVLANHGYAGREFVKKLLELGPSACRSIIADAGASFNSRYKCKFSGEERYWEQALILADLAGKLATDS